MEGRCLKRRKRNLKIFLPEHRKLLHSELKCWILEILRKLFEDDIFRHPAMKYFCTLGNRENEDDDIFLSLFLSWNATSGPLPDETNCSDVFPTYTCLNGACKLVSSIARNRNGYKQCYNHNVCHVIYFCSRCMELGQIPHQAIQNADQSIVEGYLCKTWLQCISLVSKVRHMSFRQWWLM